MLLLQNNKSELIKRLASEVWVGGVLEQIAKNVLNMSATYIYKHFFLILFKTIIFIIKLFEHWFP